LLSIRILSLAFVDLLQAISLMSQLSLHRGPIPRLMVGPWSGIRHRPTQIPPSDIMPGLA
jgi:hypothetical protein